MDVEARPFPKLYESNEPADLYAEFRARERRGQLIRAEAERRRAEADRQARALRLAEIQAEIRRGTLRREREYQAERQREQERLVRRAAHIAQYGWIEDAIHLRWPWGDTVFVGLVRWSGKSHQTPWKGRQVK
jgi:hypothetical protein